MTLGAALLASAGLLLHSFVNVMGADRGYSVERVLSVDLGLFDARYASGARRIVFFRELTQRIQTLPGVQAAGAIGGLPVNSGTSVTSQRIFYVTDNNPPAVALQRPVALIRSVTPGYFAASAPVCAPADLRRNRAGSGRHHQRVAGPTLLAGESMTAVNSATSSGTATSTDRR